MYKVLFPLLISESVVVGMMLNNACEFVIQELTVRLYLVASSMVSQKYDVAQVGSD